MTCSWSAGGREVPSRQRRQRHADSPSALSRNGLRSAPRSGVPRGIGREALAEFIAPDPAWIAAEIKEASVVAPDGTELVLNAKLAGNKVGCVLERKIFDRELVRRAAEAGADIAVKTTATGPVMEDGAVRGAHLTGDDPAGRC